MNFKAFQWKDYYISPYNLPNHKCDECWRFGTEAIEGVGRTDSGCSPRRYFYLCARCADRHLTDLMKVVSEAWSSLETKA